MTKPPPPRAGVPARAPAPALPQRTSLPAHAAGRRDLSAADILRLEDEEAAAPPAIFTPEARASWERFLGGRWQREMPSQPGEYFRATPDNHLITAPVSVYLLANGRPTTMCWWFGWWWSEPIGVMPNVPPEWVLPKPLEKPAGWTDEK